MTRMMTFWWDGDESGLAFGGSPKLSKSVHSYPAPSCSHAHVVSAHPKTTVSRLISLPGCLRSLVSKLSLPPTCPPNSGRLAVANSGAMDHMIPDKSSFVSYKSISALNACMGNNSYIPVLRQGTAFFGLNGKRVLIRNVLHVPGLAVLLYSLGTHMTQPGCGFIGSKSSGFLVYFPPFVLSVDTSVDCHLSYKTLGLRAPLKILHYAQPWCPPTCYPSERASSSSAATPSQPVPVLIEDDCSAVSDNTSTSLDPLVSTIDAHETIPPRPLIPMPPNNIAWLLHHPGVPFPRVRPCDTANASNTKTHWYAEELYRVMGCCKFRNYKHLLQVSRDGTWVDDGKFPPSLGSYVTIPKAKRGGLLDRTKY
jgi:hypothetical protein